MFNLFKEKEEIIYTKDGVILDDGSKVLTVYGKNIRSELSMIRIVFNWYKKLNPSWKDIEAEALLTKHMYNALIKGGASRRRIDFEGDSIWIDISHLPYNFHVIFKNTDLCFQLKPNRKFYKKLKKKFSYHHVKFSSYKDLYDVK